MSNKRGLSAAFDQPDPHLRYNTMIVVIDGNDSTNASRFFPLSATQFTSGGSSATLGQKAVTVWPVAGTIRNMYLVVTSPTVTDDITFAININTVNSALTLVLPHTAASAHNTTGSVHVAAGDVLSINREASATEFTSFFSLSMDFVPD